MNLCGHEIGIDKPFFLIAGPCVIENEAITMHTASVLKDITDRLNIPFIFKCSFDKANRTSSTGFRGIGFWEGLRILEKVRDEIGVLVLTDVHASNNIYLESVADVVDVLQTPALLCRQTDFIQAVAKQGKPVNIKKGQFLAPWDMANVVEKARETGNENIIVCDRGTSFGYNTLVSDMRGLQVMRETGAPVVFDASHSTQQPGGLGGCSGGQREFIPLLARAAVASGISGLFIETHPDPNKALCDGPNSLRLDDMEDLLTTLTVIDEAVKIEGI